MNTNPKPLPPDCARAREEYALALVDDPQASGPDANAAAAASAASAAAHAAACDGCARAFARMRAIWGAAGDAVPHLVAPPRSRLDAIATRALDAMHAPAIAPASVVPVAPPSNVLPFRRLERAPRRSDPTPLAIAVALAAMIAAIALLGPSLVRPPAESIARGPATPVVASQPPRVSLAKAFGEVSMVPADGSVLPALKPGDPLPPGLFSASRGAALSVEGEGLLAVRGDATVLIGGVEGSPDLAVARGEIYVDVPHGTIRTFVVHTPTGTVNVTGTAFRVKVTPNQTHVEVTRGTVVVKGPHGEQAVTAGKAANLSDDRAPALVEASDPASDPLGWVRELAPDRAPAAPAIAIRTTSKPGPAATPDATGGVAVEYRPGLDRDIVATAMEKRHASMRHCYDEELVRNPNLVVDAKLQFKVDELGRPEQLTITGIPEEHAALTSCLKAAAEAAVFPSTAPGTEITVDYQVHFTPRE